MAGVIKVDRVQSDSNLAFNIAGANVAFMDATTLRMVSSNLSLNGTNVITNGKVITSAQPAGSILQVVTTSKTDTFSGGSGAWADVTGLSLSITPSSSTSKILLLSNFTISSTNGYVSVFRLMRNSTAVGVGDTAGSRSSVAGGAYSYSGSTSYNYTQNFATHFVDSPATTSAITYKVQVFNSGTTVYVNRGVDDTDASYALRGSATITALEIAV